MARPTIAVVFLVAIAAGRPASTPAIQTASPPIFRFHTDEFWLNLHHFLYVLGRAEAKMPDASRAAVAGAPADAEQGLAALTADQRQTWREAVAFYAAGPGRKDATFDEPLSAIAAALASAGDEASLANAAIDPQLQSTLERAAPLYRKGWWPQHHAANVARHGEIQALVDRHGAAVLAFVTQAYGMRWPSGGYPVHFSGWANWAGAYSTFRGILVMSSLDRATRRFDGLRCERRLGARLRSREGAARRRVEAVSSGRRHARRGDRRAHRARWIVIDRASSLPCSMRTPMARES